MKDLTNLQSLIYEYIKNRIEKAKIHQCSVISWHIRLYLRNEYGIEITTKKINYECVKLIKLGLIERDKNHSVSENYGIQYVLKNN